jgi:hypothetical protein
VIQSAIPDFGAWQAADWSALASVVTALVAILAAAFAWRQVTEARKTREDQAQPFVVVDFEPSNVSFRVINLVIRNVGRTLARDVQLKFDPLLSSTHLNDKWDLNDTTLIREGIPSLPPGKEIKALFDLAHERFKSDLPMAYTVTVEFSDARDRRQTPLVYKLDLNVYYGLQSVTEYGLHDAASALREIEKSVKKWTAHFNGLRVYVHDEDELQRKEFEDFERERREREASSDDPSDGAT